LKLLILLFSVTVISQANAAWQLEFFGGSAHSFGSNLEILDSSGREVDLDARYETRPFEDAPYYAWRISHTSARHGWGVEFVHHKIYLKNTTPEIREFEISHGYNLLMLDYARSVGTVTFRVGGGAVIGYPHANINGEETLGGYQLAGPAGQIAVSKNFPINNRFFFAIEGKFTFARAVVDLESHEARAPNFAFHGLGGLGIRFP